MPRLPQIGFDRYISLDWIAAVLMVRSGEIQDTEIDALLDDTGLGREAKSKTKTKLNALGLSPRTDLADFINRGVNISCSTDFHDQLVTFAWGSAIVSYPFFGKVSELIGRLTSLQGDCSVAEIHRRMMEKYGERQVIKRATQAVIQTQVAWGVVERIADRRRLVRMHQIVTSDEQVVAWLIEAALRYVGKAAPIPTLSSLTVLYPFVLDQPIAYLASKSPNLEVRSEGSGSQSVGLRSWQ